MITSDNTRPVYIVSIPRSGQHMLERVLNEIYTEKGLEYSYCEYYRGDCFPTGICNKQCKFIKSHDFDFRLHPKDHTKYIFLYREDRLEQLEAFFRMTNKKVNYDDEHTYRRLIDFCREHLPYYNKMMNKWCKPAHNILCIDYNNFINKPILNLSHIAAFLKIPITENEIHDFYQSREEKFIKRNNIEQVTRTRMAHSLFGAKENY